MKLRGLLHKSFLERNQLIIGLIGIVFILGGSAVALLLTGGVLADTYKVSAKFTDAAGLRGGDDVTVAGLEAGNVSGVRIDGGQVVVDMKVASDVKLPRDTGAEIVVETVLGKKSVNLVAGESENELKDGDLIPASRTITPVEVTDVNDVSVRLLNESDAEGFNQLLDEVSQITEGKSGELETLIDGLSDVSLVLADRKAELSGLIKALDTLAQTFAEKDDTIVSIVDRYNRVLGNLAERQTDLRILLQATDLASHEIADLVRRNRPDLDRTLINLHKTLKVVDNHQVDLAAAIPYLEASVRGYSSTGYSQGVPNRWANIFVQSLGPLGVDQILGPCGLLDNAFDELLGEDPRSCAERGRDTQTDDQQESRDRPASEDDDKGLLPEDLPGSINDLIEQITGLSLLGGGR